MSSPDEVGRQRDGASACPALVGGGLMGDLIRSHDWAATPLGPISAWPMSLVVSVGLCLDTAVPTAVFYGADLRLLYNDAYAAMLADRHPWALGRPGAEVWTDAWGVIGPQFAAVVATGRGFSSADQRFDLVRNGRSEETYFQYSFNPIRDEAGRVVGIFNFGIDVTERVLAERRRAREIDHLRTMFEQAPGCIAVSSGPDHVFEVANRAYRRLMGDRPLVGRPVRAVVPELAEQGFTDLMDRVYATGEPFVARRAPVELPREPGGPLVMHFFDYLYQPITDASGAITGLFVQGTDVTEQVRAEERLRANEARQAFRAELAAALGGDDPAEIMAVASGLFGQHLGASRVASIELDGSGATGTIAREWSDGSVASVVGQHQLADFGPIVAEARRAGVVTVDDIALDPRTRHHAARFRGFEIASFLSAALVKNGQLAVILGVHGRTPRAWSDDDRTLALEVAERTWAAVERARAEAALRRSEVLHRSVVEQASDGIWLTGADGCYLDVNPAACAILGYTREQYLAMTVTDVIPSEDRPRLADLMTQILGGARSREVGNFRRSDGRVVPLELSLSCLPDGRPLAVGRDITERLRAEGELRSLAADLSEADRRKDEFLAMLAHELRNPLGTIGAAVQLARVDAAPGFDGEFGDLVCRQVVHLTHLIDDLLDVSRITQGKITLQPATIDLAGTVARAVELVRPIIEQKRHALHVTLPDAPVRFVADPTRAEQMLGNLLTNAAKYTEPGGRIDLDARTEGDEVVFRVRDNGVGIDPTMLSEVFGLFTQVDATIDRAQGGLGIGLTLVRNLVERHGGTVHAASPGRGHGSEFAIRLPIGPVDAEPTPPPRPPSRPPPRRRRVASWWSTTTATPPA